MNTVKHVAMLTVTVVILGLSSGCMPYSTASTEVGVRTVKWSLFSESGVEEKEYPPGTTQWFVPLITDWHTFDTRLHNLEMTEEVGRGDRKGRDDLLFKTIDGNDIGLDVIVSYQIIPDLASTVLQEVAETDEELKDAIVRTVARSKPRDIFGELLTEEFYDAKERTAKAEEVQVALNAILNPMGVQITRVGTRDYRFNPEYQAAIEKKKVADQEAEKLKSETKATLEEFLTAVEEAKAEVEKIMAEADGEFRRATIEVDAYYEQQESLAQAIIAEGKAEAEGIRELNAALSGSGGEAMVKLKIAETLSGKRILMLPLGGGGSGGGDGMDIRTTDINKLLEVYGLQKVSGAGK